MDRLYQLERALEAFTKPTWFDGKQVTPPTTAATVSEVATRCTLVTKNVEGLWSSLPANIQTLDRSRAAHRKYTELVPYCKALSVAAVALQKVAEAEAAQKAQNEAAEVPLREKRIAFQKDIPGIAEMFLKNFLPFYDKTLTSFGSSSWSDSPEYYATAKQGYLALRPICKKHAPLANPTGPDASRNVMHRPVDACAMADQGEQLVQKVRRDFAFAAIRYDTKDHLDLAQKFIDGAQKDLPEIIQLMLFDQPAFLAIKHKQIAPRAAAIGEAAPGADAWTPAFAKNAEVEAKIEAYGSVVFAMPKFRDASAEAAAKAAFAKAFKGVKVKKIATDWEKWNVWDEKLWVGSDATYDYYKLNKGKNKYMRGAALLEIPGRPYCQVRTWEVSRVYNGPIKVSPFVESGTFAKCE